MICPKCYEKRVACPECGKEFPHGSKSHCDNSSCIKVNAPLDCVGCGLTVEQNLTGVLTFDMELIPYIG